MAALIALYERHLRQRQLERHGVDTTGWWDEALGLEMLGTLVQFGWEKALGGPGAELDWWETWAAKGAEWLM